MSERDKATAAATSKGELPPLNDSEVALLATFARALLPSHGAAAVEKVKSVASQTRNLREIISLLAHDIADESKRSAFVRRAKVAVHAHREARKSTASNDPSGFTNRRITPLTPELMAHAEEALKPSVGEHAAVLVARYASSTDSSRDFFEQLSTHLRTPAERKSLFKAARRANAASQNKA
jgi:hypothetical protein